jgi:hypothetical protein
MQHSSGSYQEGLLRATSLYRITVLASIRVMAAFRLTSAMGALRSAARPRAMPMTRAFIVSPRALYADQGYGDGKGNPQAEDPQNQPASNETKHSQEHPGPAPPDVGKGTGGGPTKAPSGGSSSPEDASAASGGSRSKEAAETGSSPTGGSIGGTAQAAGRVSGEGLKGPQGEDAPQPKIHNQSIPAEKEGLTSEQQQEVEQHNKDFEKRHDRAAPANEDKVDKNFWQGNAGR